MNVNTPEKLTDYPWLNLFRVKWANRGKTGEWFFASRKDVPLTGKVMPVADAVVIVPIHVLVNPLNNKEWRRLVVEKEFRIPVGDYEYGFPAGIKHPEESTITCATRELKEETGLTLTKVLRVSPPIYSSTGLGDESVVMVFCECEGEISAEGREVTEEMSVHLLDIEQITELCNNYKEKQGAKLWPVLLMFSTLGTLELKCD